MRVCKPVRTHWWQQVVTYTDSRTERCRSLPGSWRRGQLPRGNRICPLDSPDLSQATRRECSVHTGAWLPVHVTVVTVPSALNTAPP